MLYQLPNHARHPPCSPTTQSRSKVHCISTTRRGERNQTREDEIIRMMFNPPRTSNEENETKPSGDVRQWRYFRYNSKKLFPLVSLSQPRQNDDEKKLRIVEWLFSHISILAEDFARPSSSLSHTRLSSTGVFLLSHSRSWKYEMKKVEECIVVDERERQSKRRDLLKRWWIKINYQLCWPFCTHNTELGLGFREHCSQSTDELTDESSCMRRRWTTERAG